MRAPRALRNTGADAAFLCYHSIAAPGPPFLSIAPQQFRDQLETLRAGGWVSGSEELLPQLNAGRRLSRPAAFLTFDDGYVDNYTEAFPLLREFGFNAFVFIVPDFVDTGGSLCWRGIEAPCAEFPAVMRSMTWAMVEEMAAHGVVFGSHTLTHPRLPRIDDEQLRDELLTSRRRIEGRLGACTTLAYPFGGWDERVRAAARDAGYSWAFALPGQGPREVDELSIPRIAIDHRDSARRFAVKLSVAGRVALVNPTAHALLSAGWRRVERLQRFAGSSR